MKKLLLLAICCIGLTTVFSEPTAPVEAALPIPATTVFVIVMENHNWSQIKNSSSAPYMNSLLKLGAHAEAYYNPPGLHPSEPNYLWMEAGTNFGVTNDQAPVINHQSSRAHLTTLLDGAGIPWKSYQEDIVGDVCPLTNKGLYAVRHNPMVFFDDVTGTNNPQSVYCINHNRPYTELATELTQGTVAQYNFISPNLCNDMHNVSGCATKNSVKNGDNWLKQAIPPILASSAYQNGGIILITWDEGLNSDGPIGMIVLSPHAKVNYSNTVHYTHSSFLRSMQEIFGLKPFLGDAVNAIGLSDLFDTYPSLLPIAPANDNFANGVAISGLPYTRTQNNALASLESAEQRASCDAVANIMNTVWYKYTATANQKVTFSITGPAVVKGISVWTGSALGTLTQVGCGTGVNASAKVDTTSGMVYYIRIGSSNGVGSDFTLQTGLPPPNDDLANAVAINTDFTPFTDAKDVLGASLEIGDPNPTCGGLPTFRTVWYKYSALGNNTITVDTTGSGYDTVLSIWAGAGLSALTQLGCNDNAAPGVTTSALTLNTLPATYFIGVSSKGGSTSNLSLNTSLVSSTDAPPVSNYYTTANPTLTWNRLDNISQYNIEVSTSALFDGLIYSATVPASQVAVTLPTVTEGVYYWRVSADNGLTWSPAERFIVDLP